MNQEPPASPPKPPAADKPALGSGTPDRRTPRGLWDAISSLALFILIPALIAIFLTAFVIQSYQVDGVSMETTLQDHDRLIVDKLPRTWSRITHHQYVPARGDIIVFDQTGLPDSFFQKQLIKRVIGLPTERVLVHGGHVTIFNAAHPGGFNPDTSGRYHIAAKVTTNDIDVTLQSDEIFVLGDNRPNSEDSRFFGPIKTSAIVGKLVLRIYPLGKTEAF